jgi:membrane-bound lytic murein transglycosylase B
VDAVYSAAHLLCTDGGGDPATVPRAIFAYNHSSDYVAQVQSLASSYRASNGAGRG